MKRELGLERGQPLPDRRPHRGPADGSAGEGAKRVAQYYAAARKVFGTSARSSRSTSSTGPTSAGRVSYIREVQALRQADARRSGASTTTPTRTASRRRARSACSALGQGRGLADRDRRASSSSARRSRTARRAPPRRWAACSRSRKSSSGSSGSTSTSSTARRRATKFDAGLIDLDGKKRPGYTVVQKRKARRCHK